MCASSLTRGPSARARAIAAISALPLVTFMPVVSVASGSPQVCRARATYVRPKEPCSALRALK